MANPAAKRKQILDLLHSAWEKAQQADCRPGLAIVNSVVRKPEFASLPEAARLSSYEIAAMCAENSNDEDTSYRYAMIGTQSGKSSMELWQIRLWLEVKQKRYSQAVDTVVAMGARHPEALNAEPIRMMYSVDRALKQMPDKRLRSRFVEALASPAYQPDDVSVTGDYFKKEHATALADSGDENGARTLLSMIVEPDVLIDASLDSRLRDFMPTDFDGRAAVEARLAQVREIAASHVGSLAAVTKMADLLRKLGRAEEAIATLGTVRLDDAQETAFVDIENKNWWWNSMAYSYAATGRYEEAVAAFRAAMKAGENGARNVSQTLNLAHTHLRFGHPDRVLAEVADVPTGPDALSPYGEMVLRVARGCANLMLGAPTSAKVDQAYLAEHERDHPTALFEFLLCADDMDGAAGVVVRGLDDPDRRPQFLLALSDYDAPPANVPLTHAEQKLPALKARADVQAAIRRAGGTRRFRLQE